jgi:hypothetical protein
MAKKSRSRSGIRDEHTGSYFRELRKILKFCDADPDPGSGIFLIWNQDGKTGIRDPGKTSRIRNIVENRRKFSQIIYDGIYYCSTRCLL